jgi:hypothetical protein
VGTWFTNWGRLEITQNGTNVTGVYGTERHTLTGTISGKIFSGTYSENGDTGPFKFVLSSDGKKFEGTFDNGGGDWNGFRDSEPHRLYLRILDMPSNWSGTWETDWGTLVIRQNGTTVTGTYDYYENCEISGTVQNNKLMGTYIEKKGSDEEKTGLFEFYMLQGGNSFKGWWGDDQNATAEWNTWDGSKTVE